MGKERHNNNSLSATKIMLAAIVFVVLMGGVMTIPADMETANALLMTYLAVFAPLTVVGLIADSKKGNQRKALVGQRKFDTQRIADKYNSVNQMLVDAYRADKASTPRFMRESLRADYERRYLDNKAAFLSEYQEYMRQWKQALPKNSRLERFWKMLITAGIGCALLGSCYAISASTPEQQPQPERAVSTDGEPTMWTAKTIPMPHLTDGSRYVSNPDQVVSLHTEQLLNQTCRKLDDSLGIESVFVIVNHVADRDIFRFAQDVFDTYHVGKQDRGLVVVLAYEDHLVRSHTGYALEADLTDIECSRLQQDYIIPCVKAEMPDSAMLYFAEAVYNTLRHKELPQMVLQNNDDEEGVGLLFFYFAAIGCWLVLLSFIGRRYAWFAPMATGFMSNPFQRVVVVTSGGGFGGGGFGVGGGFSGGGGFGGGGSGGGGATSSW